MRNPPRPDYMYRGTEKRRHVGGRWLRDVDLMSPLQRAYVKDCATTGKTFHRQIFDLLAA